MIDIDDDEGEIPLPTVSENILRMAVDFAESHKVFF